MGLVLLKLRELWLVVNEKALLEKRTVGQQKLLQLNVNLNLNPVKIVLWVECLFLKGEASASQEETYCKEANGPAEATLKKHSVHHSAKHMAMMRKEMKAGASFTAAHKKAQKKVG